MKRLLGEFEEQSFTQIIFPHAKTDWLEYLGEAETTFVNIINAIIEFQKCLVICYDLKSVQKFFTQHENLYFIEYTTDDTWARDSSALCLAEDGVIKLLNFNFTAWGGKFEASKDNAMNQAISKHYSSELKSIDFILEGGAIESNGEGIILTTSACMFNANRNATLNKLEISQKIKDELGAKEVLYLKHGYLSGDDTDSHIDTLARFIDETTIMYVKCTDKDDEHYSELNLMGKELEIFAKKYHFSLISLPMSTALYYEKERLPATYANFLLVNNGVIVPTYGVKEDKIALDIFKKTFTRRKVIGVDCSVLVREHGSLHCVSMNFAKGVEII